MAEQAIPDEVVTFGPGTHRLHPDDHPEHAELRIFIRGGSGGAAADGTLGEDGDWVDSERIPFDQNFTIKVGRGGRGSGGGQDGEHGMVIVELFR